jgi:hypothetical protein
MAYLRVCTKTLQAVRSFLFKISEGRSREILRNFVYLYLFIFNSVTKLNLS